MRKSLWLLIAFGLLITACSKDDDKTDGPSAYLPKVKEIQMGTYSTSTAYEYDDEKRITKITVTEVSEDGVDTYIKSITYAGDKTTVISRGSGTNDVHTYVLQKDQNRVLITNSSGEYKYFDTLYIDSEQRILKKSGNNVVPTTFTYDNTGNISKAVYVDRIGITEYTYDSKLNICTNIALPSWLLYNLDLDGNVNNMIKETYTEGINVYEISNVYKYSDSNFPTQMVSTIKSTGDSHSFTTTITYY